MADRDWDKELAKVDKQLASLSDDKLAAPVPGGQAAPQPSGKAAAREPMGEPKPTTSFGVYARLTISVLLGVAMLVWPYPARCGAGLSAYLAAVVVVITGGVWSAIWTWRHRAAHAHTLSLLLILWGLVLGSIEVLPRAGYAKPDLQHPARWVCPAK
jgi:putative flippase GtrA